MVWRFTARKRPGPMSTEDPLFHRGVGLLDAVAFTTVGGVGEDDANAVGSPDAGTRRRDAVVVEPRGELAGRESDEQITVFDSTGIALQDSATVPLEYERAVESGVGVEKKMIST